jgi:hypothetical protein
MGAPSHFFGEYKNMADIARAVKQPHRSDPVVSKTASWSVRNSDSGKTFLFDSTTRIIATLPAITKLNDGTTFTFVVKQLDGGATGHTVTPNSANYIQYAAAGGSVTIAHSMIAAVAGDQVGQSVTLVAHYPSLSWIPKATHGTWTKA